jgi:hypothetical protein
MSAEDDALVEIDAQLGVLNPQYEGLKDFLRLNIKPETTAAVQAVLTLYDKRVGLLATTKDMLARLRIDGHPATFDMQQVAAIVYADLADQQATISAAFGIFASDPATALGLSASPPETK